MNKIASSASGVLVKRECFSKTGIFDEHLTAYEDWDMWLRLSQYYEFDFVNKKLVSIRRYSKNMQNNKLHMFSSALYFYNKWLSILPKGIEIPRIWVEIIIEKIFTRLPKIDFIKLLYQRLSKQSRNKIFKLAFQNLKIYLLLKIILLPLTVLINNARLIKNYSIITISKLFTKYKSNNKKIL